MESPFVTEENLRYLCDLVIEKEDQEALKITLANGSEIPLFRQFFTYYKRCAFRYEMDETVTKAAYIYKHAKQSILKYKLAVEKLEKLNTPEAFFTANVSNSDSSSSGGSINTTEGTNKAKNQALNFSRTDSEAIASANAIGRSGSSQINEDYKNLESNWRIEDKKLQELSNKTPKNSFDIQIPDNLENISLKTQIISSQVSDSQESREQEVVESPEVSYTGISINKNLSNNKSEALSMNKALNTSLNSGESTQKTINSNLSNNKNNNLSLNFVYGDSTYKALSLFVANFRETFLSSFDPLFYEFWTGY